MQPVLEFLLRYGYWVLLLNVLAEQLAVPIPATPVLLAMGALAGLGRFSFITALAIASLTCLACDQVWYRLGRARGHVILRLICRMSLEPDSCVSNTKTTFARWGAWSLVVAKFVPGLSAVAAPLAGFTRVPMLKFLSADLAGSVLWTGSFLAAGFLFRNQLEKVAERLSRFGGWVVFILCLAAAAYVGFKFLERQRFLRNLRVSRITPDELRAMQLSGEDVAVVDLRHSIELEDGVKIPGAIWIAMDQIETRRDELPDAAEVILYCS